MNYLDDVSSTTSLSSSNLSRGSSASSSPTASSAEIKAEYLANQQLAGSQQQSSSPTISNRIRAQTVDSRSDSNNTRPRASSRSPSFLRLLGLGGKQTEYPSLPSSFDGTSMDEIKGYGEVEVEGAFVLHDQYLKEEKNENNNDRVGVITVGKRTYVTVTDAPGFKWKGTVPASLISGFFINAVKKGPKLSKQSLTEMVLQAVDPEKNAALAKFNRDRKDEDYLERPTGIALCVERSDKGMTVIAACAGDTNGAILQENGTSTLLFQAMKKGVHDAGGGFTLGERDEKGTVTNLKAEEISIKGKAVLIVGSDAIFDNTPLELMSAIIHCPAFDTIPKDLPPTDYRSAPKAKNLSPFDLPFPRHYTKEEFTKQFPQADSPYSLSSDAMQKQALQRLKNFMEWEKPGYQSTYDHINSAGTSKPIEHTKNLRKTFITQLETLNFKDHKTRDRFNAHISSLQLNEDQTGLSDDSVKRLLESIQEIGKSPLNSSQKDELKAILKSAIEAEMLVRGLEYAVWGKPDDRTVVCIAHTEVKK